MFGIFSFQGRVRKLRKRWDRLREKSLKKKEPLKSRLLLRLDQTEQNLRTLEERRVTRVERARIAKEIELDLEEVKAAVRAKEEEILAEQGAQETKRQNT